MVKEKRLKEEEEDYDDAASHEDAQDPVLEVMLAVAGPGYRQWTKMDVTGLGTKAILKPLTLTGGDSWLGELNTTGKMSKDMLVHVCRRSTVLRLPTL